MSLTGRLRRAPQFLNSLVQIWYHLGYFRSARRPGGNGALPKTLVDVEQRGSAAEAIYSASNPCQLSGAKKSRAGPSKKAEAKDANANADAPLLAEVLPALREIFVRLQDSRDVWNFLRSRSLSAFLNPVLCSALLCSAPDASGQLLRALRGLWAEGLAEDLQGLGVPGSGRRHSERERESSSRRIPTSSVRRSSSAWSRSSCPRRRCSRPSHASSFSSTEKSQEKEQPDNFGKTHPTPQKKKQK